MLLKRMKTAQMDALEQVAESAKACYETFGGMLRLWGYNSAEIDFFVRSWAEAGMTPSVYKSKYAENYAEIRRVPPVKVQGSLYVLGQDRRGGAAEGGAYRNGIPWLQESADGGRA